ncbi:MAG: (2Fe-2S)-binding protein [Hyphomicrobiaceae bacterium]
MVMLSINGKQHALDAPDDMPLLWVLRDLAGLRGTKFGCGAGLCGACTVLLGDEAVRSCQTTLGDAADQKITTIEQVGEIAQGAKVQAAWQEVDVPQCGYCQSGQIMSATALLMKVSQPNPEQIDEAMNGNICRCGTYGRIRTAIDLATSK